MPSARTFLGALGGSLSVLMGVVIAANISNVVDPRTGFAGTLSIIGTASPGSPTANLHHAFTTWLQPGSSGESIASPAATRRTALTISVGAVSFKHESVGSGPKRA